MNDHPTHPAIGRILFVDKDIDMREMMESVLKNDQFLIVTVHSAEEGLQQLAVDDPFDFVISGYTLPGMSGIVVNRIKLTGFDFKQLDFTADRLLVSSTTDYPDNKYLMFPNRKAGGSTVNEISIMLIPEGSPLLTEDLYPLDLEF